MATVMAPGKDTGVLVVGGGPVGLSLGIELARLGVATTLVEARDGRITTPKMNFVNVRSMEFVRRWGLTDEVRRAGHPEDFHPNVNWATAVTGHEIARLDFPPFLDEKTRFVSPAADCLVSQLWFDPILLAHARKQPDLTLHHRTRLEAFRETEDGIEAQVVDLVANTTRTITAAYIAGCDGASSPVREGLGIGLDGLPNIQNNFHISSIRPSCCRSSTARWARRGSAAWSGRKAFGACSLRSIGAGFGASRCSRRRKMNRSCPSCCAARSAAISLSSFWMDRIG
jgi:2-polyprenyl-6-methoxyphenol hydroxylase-like FAD-dependent oxidoreductase